jgi:hypothetical protein
MTSSIEQYIINREHLKQIEDCERYIEQKERFLRNINYGKLAAIAILTLMLTTSTIAVLPRLFTSQNCTLPYVLSSV